MNKILLTAAALLTFFCSMAATKVIENPLLGVTNVSNSTLDFRRIEITDTSTVLHAHVKFRPKWWITISPESFIEANGKQYYIKGASGIELGEHHYMSETGESDFILYFQPIPADTKTINFKESDNSTGWAIWNIDLTGLKQYPMPAGVPKALAKESKMTKIPMPVMDVDSVTVRIHLLNYTPDMGSTVNYFINHIGGQTNDLPPVQVDENGVGTVKFMQYGPGYIAFYRIDDKISISGGATIAPGENIDIYADCNLSGRWAMEERPGYTPSREPAFWHTGRYYPIDKALYSDKYYGLNMRSGRFADYHMTGDEYVNDVINKYNTTIAEVKADKSLTPLQKDLFTINLSNDLLNAIDDYKALARLTYWIKHNCYGQDVPKDSIKTELKPEHYRKIASMVDPNDYRLMFAKGSYRYNDLKSPEWTKAGVNAKNIDDMRAFSILFNKANNGTVTDAEIDSLRTLSSPVYAKAVESRNNDIKSQLAGVDFSLSQPTPDVATGSIFDAIIAPHKGKVVVVDLWNTWCGPCRAALAQHEPGKSTDLSSEDIVWIYIADESSPTLKYYNMIPGIKGLHYRLTPEQIRPIHDRFKTDGIPYYILVDRQGNAAERPDLRDEAKYKAAILDALSKK